MVRLIGSYIGAYEKPQSAELVLQMIGQCLRHRPYYKRDEKFNDLDAAASGNPNQVNGHRVVTGYIGSM